MSDRAVLFDATKCVGCGSCTVACKLYNGLPTAENAHGYEAALNDKTWTVVNYKDVKVEGSNALRFVKRQCMHCLEPSCVAVCFAKAITVSDEGAVVYDPQKCVGCRYCMIGCPYDVPKYEWNKVFPSIMKCRFCAEKIAGGEAPACVSVCPSGALTFGDREKLIAEAHATIAADHRYEKRIYGEQEGGGTRWLYIADVPFDELGLPDNIPDRPIPATLKDYTKVKPGLFLSVAAAFGALGLYTKRRLRIENEKNAEREGGEDDA